MQSDSRLFELVLPVTIFYMLILLRLLSSIFIKFFRDTQRDNKNLIFGKGFRGSEFAIIAIVLDIVGIKDALWFFKGKYGLSMDNGSMHFIVPLLLFVVHLQIYLLTQYLEHMIADPDKLPSYRVRLRLTSMISGVIAMFTNAITITALLGTNGF